MADKFSGVWLSHSSIGDFLNCPRLYYLRAIYKDPITGHKISRVEPALTLGGVVHDVLESLSVLPATERMTTPIMAQYELAWKEVSGKKGGFKTIVEELEYKERGKKMLERIIAHPGPLLEKAIKIAEDLPWYWLNEEENLILCGKIDWLVYKPETDSVQILDFKTGKYEEKETSLQLPIYHLLVKNTQKREVSGAAYWYIAKDDEPHEVSLPSLTDAYDKVLTIGRRIKLARQLAHFECPQGGCKYCIPLEAIKNGKGEKVGESKIRQDLYIL